METGSSSVTLSVLLLVGLLIVTTHGQNYTIDSVTVSNTSSQGSTPPLVIGTSGTYTITCSVVVFCSSTCNDDMLDIGWSLNGEDIAMGFSGINSSPMSVTNNGTFTSSIVTTGTVSVNHTGVYSCMASLDSGSTLSNTNSLSVKLPTPSVSVTNNTVDVDGNIALTCTPTLASVPSVTYTYLWSPVADNDNMLNIASADISNAGQHTCTVTAMYVGSAYVVNSDSSMGSGYLTVRVTQLTTVNATGTATVTAGSSQTFMCSATPPSGGSVSKYQWTNSSGIVSNASSHTINNVSITDAGTYTCTVTVTSNGSFIVIENTTATGTATLTVNVTQLTTVAATGTATVTAGSNHTFMCSATPPPGGSVSTYQWTNPSGTVVSNVSSHTINPVSITDAGTYTCTVTVTNSSAYIVIGNPTATGNATLTVNIPGDIIVSITPSLIVAVGGSNTSLNCSATPPSGLQVGDVSYTYQWTGPSNFNANTQQVSVGTAGTYTCAVTGSSTLPFVSISNPMNNASSTLYIASASVDPTNITRLDVSPYDSFNITCTVIVPPPSGTFGYSYSWQPSTGLIFSDNNMNTNTATISGLSANSTYTCTPNVTVTGGTGTAMPSAFTNVIIKGSSPPFQPILIEERDITPNRATISWTVSQVAYTPETYTVIYGVDNALNLRSSVVSTLNVDNRQFITDTNLVYSVTLTELSIGIMYCYVIEAVNINNAINSTNQNCFNTTETVPNPPSNVTLVPLNSTALLLTWDEPMPYTGEITEYNYSCSGLNYTSAATGLNIRSVTLTTGLMPFREYICNVTAATKMGAGNPANDTAVTNEAAPNGPPLSFTVNSTNPIVLILSWQPPNIEFRNGIITSYNYYCMDGSTQVGTNTTIGTSAMVNFPSIDAHTNYTCFVSASTRIGAGPHASATGTTAQAVPSVVTNLATESRSNNSFYISWGEPADPNGIIISYTVTIIHYTNGSMVTTNVTDEQSIVIDNQGLVPEVPYNISVSAATSAGRGMPSTEVNFTRQGIAPSIQEVNFTRINDTSLNITWRPLTIVEAKGFILYYFVSLSSGSSRKRQDLSMNVSHTQSSVVFSGLDSGASYSVSVGAVNGQGVGNVSEPLSVPPAVEPSTGLSTGTVVGIAVVIAIITVAIVVILIILALLYLRHKRTKGELTVHANMSVLDHSDMKGGKGASSEFNGKEELELVAIKTTDDENRERWIPVPVTEFANHTAKLHSNRDLGFEEEYKTFKNSPQGSYMASKLPHNIPKNRFDNVFPYDSSRVELTQIPDSPGTDYINASYIDGYRRPKAYIAAQGPLHTTVGDFWRMTWEFQLPTIVMLTELVERGIDKCTCYWPRGLNETIDVGYNLKVTLVEQQQFVDYKLKKFLLLNTSSDGGRLDVTHYHFLAWPDHGVPADKTIMLAFIRRVRAIHKPDGPPLIVHCSAGVGRTGTFITLDTMMQRLAAEEDTLNVYEFLADMRTKRVLMVQTEAQYVYIHNALTEYITCGDTSMTIKTLQITMDDLSKVTEHKSGYQKQLELLNEVCKQPSDGLCTDATIPRNSNKNRYPAVLETLPYDMTRVRLKTASGDGDYINANHVDGYKHRGAFLATQAPMENTAEDLWRMVWEQWSSSMVMLCNLEEKEKEVSTRYWPENVEESVTFGKMNVKLLSEEMKPHYVVRKIMLSQESTYINVAAGSADHLIVTQYHYLKWPEDEMPKDETPILKLVDQLLHNQMNTGNKAITVMCNDGIGRTGVFMGIYSILERIKIEGVADIFQYIKGARFNRAGLITNVVQYEFCHNVILEYLNSFDAYHNF